MRAAQFFAGMGLMRSGLERVGVTRVLQGVGLSSMRFHPTGGGPEDDKDGQVAWFTARIASLIG